MADDISLCMVVKDEPVDRIVMLYEYMKPVVSKTIIADTGSQRPDVELYEAVGIDAFKHPWKNDFSEARNAVMARADTEWILSLDADEIPSLGMMQALQWVREQAPKKVLGYQFWTINYWAGIRGISMPYHWHCRLFRRKVGKWYLPVHEGVMLRGKTEAVSMENGTMIHATEDAYLIHSKPEMHMERANTLYVALGSEPTP